MDKGSKRRHREDIGKIVSNWDEIDWGYIMFTKDEKAEKEKNERKRIRDTKRRRK